MKQDIPTPVPVAEIGGRGQTAHLAVANGFPWQTYKPLLDPLTDDLRIFSTLPRALWPSPPPPESFTTWREMANDILEGLRQRDLRDVIAIGHSMGGVASMLAAIAEPERFKALVLLDPTFLPPCLTRMVWLLRLVGQSQRFPLAQGALRRRANFMDLEEAIGYWAAKPLFRDWPPETLRLYAEAITRASANGGLELAWSPEWEARYYQTVFLEWRREVPRLRGLLPVLAIQGAETDAFTDASVTIVKRLVPDAAFARIEGHGHLFPQSAPDQARGIIKEWLQTL